MSARRLLPQLVAAALAVLAASCGGVQQTIRIAIMADCEGPEAGFYDVTLAGAELPLLREIVVGPSIPPLGIVTVEYAKHQADVTFAVTSWEVLTALNPGANVFRFTSGYAQGEAGLGSYAYHRLGWRRAVTIAYPDPLGWGWAAGPVAEFCSLGGEIVDRVWLYDPPEKLPERLAQIPTEGIDGYFVMTNGPEAGAFLEQLARSEPDFGRKVVSSAAAATGLDRAVIARLGKRLVAIVLAWDVPGPGFPPLAATGP
jgi:ABC-type branched-subunit amino acid transport system substrate-binding protein